MGSIQVQVFDAASAKPISGATVQLDSKVQKTDANGKTTFINLTDGEYYLVTVSMSGYETKSINCTTGEIPAFFMEKTSLPQPTPTNPPHTINFTVVGEGQPVAGATVIVKDKATGKLAKQDTTGIGTGRVAISLVKGDYLVHAEMVDYAAKNFEPSPDYPCTFAQDGEMTLTLGRELGAYAVTPPSQQASTDVIYNEGLDYVPPVEEKPQPSEPEKPPEAKPQPSLWDSFISWLRSVIG